MTLWTLLVKGASQYRVHWTTKSVVHALWGVNKVLLLQSMSSNWTPKQGGHMVPYLTPYISRSTMESTIGEMWRPSVAGGWWLVAGGKLDKGGC